MSDAPNPDGAAAGTAPRRSRKHWFRGRCAVVTGGSRGLGPLIADALAEEGMRVVVAARHATELEQVAERLRAAGREALAVPGDITDPAFRQRLISTAEATFGQVDVLVNNAGVMNMSRFHSLPPEEIDHVVAVNLLATLQLTRAVVPGMVQRRRGHVVNISSLAGRVGAPYDAVYSATKAGQIAFTHALRAEYHGTGVRFSVICPGFVEDTGMWHDSAERYGARTNRLIGSSPPDKVARAVVDAVIRNLPEVYVNWPPVRPLLAIGEASPRLRERVARWMGLNRVYERALKAAGRS